MHQTTNMPGDQARTSVMRTLRLTLYALQINLAMCGGCNKQPALASPKINTPPVQTPEHAPQPMLTRRAAAAPRAGAPGRRWRPGCRPAGWRARARRCPPRRAGAPRCPGASSGAPAAACPPFPPAASPRAACAAPPVPAVFRVFENPRMHRRLPLQPGVARAGGSILPQTLHRSLCSRSW